MKKTKQQKPETTHLPCGCAVMVYPLGGYGGTFCDDHMPRARWRRSS